MSKRFENLRKVPPEPAAKLLANANTKLLVKPALPASAPVPAVLGELEKMNARLEMLRLLSVALPPREATWWACLAARDLVGLDAKQVPPPLAAAESWVFKPSEENRVRASEAYHHADMEDDTVFCAMAALYADGSMGPGDMKQYPAPPNGVSAAVFAMNLISLKTRPAEYETFMDVLIDRALDIARGGNGRAEAGQGKQVELKG